MRAVSMNVEIEYLLQFLRDELSDLPDLRIHPVAPSSTQKSLDLPQDYDSDANDLHLQRGVRVRQGSSSREYFFPANWVRDQKLDFVYELVKEIRMLNSKD